MQFGRLHGVALIVLGIILLGGSGNNFDDSKVSQNSRRNLAKVSEHRATWFPGIIGTVSLLAGIGLFVTQAAVTKPPAEHAVK